MLLKGIIVEDFTNYKLPSMLIIFPTCSWKCGEDICQNRAIKDIPNITIDINEIVQRYIANPISKALVCSGLEPFDSYDDLIELITVFRRMSNNAIVIYTGYTEEEITNMLMCLSKNTITKTLYEFENIIIKYGRYIQGRQSHYDCLLGVNLYSSNQYAKQIR